jgi:hypothetical protein
MRSGFLSCAFPALVGVRSAAVLLFANCRRRVCDTKKQKAVFILPDLFRFGLDAKIHSTLTTIYISRILILYIYGKFIGSRDKKGKIDALERPTRGKPLFSVSKISKVKNSAKTVNINQFEKIHPATIKIINPGGVSKNLHYRAKIPKSQKISLQP